MKNIHDLPGIRTRSLLVKKLRALTTELSETYLPKHNSFFQSNLFEIWDKIYSVYEPIILISHWVWNDYNFHRRFPSLNTQIIRLVSFMLFYADGFSS
jgi:hypothetical protein